MVEIPDAARPLDTSEARFMAVRDYETLTRDDFDALAEAARAVILVELRAVAECKDTTLRVNRWGREYTVPAGYVTAANDLVGRFTRELPPRVDMSTEAVAARVLAAIDDREVHGIAAGLTVDAIQRVSMANQWGRGSDGWKRAKHVESLIACARNARIKRALDAGDDATLWREYERARDDAARADGPAPARQDMRPLVEVFRGRKLRTVKGTQWGTVSTFVNGHPADVDAIGYGSGPEGLAKAAQQLRRDVIGADERRITRPDAAAPEWFKGAPAPHPAVVAYCTHAARREAADRAALAAPDEQTSDGATVEQLDPTTGHALVTTPDDKYPHLVYGACTCGGWRSSGAARPAGVTRWFERHVGEQAADPWAGVLDAAEVAQ